MYETIVLAGSVNEKELQEISSDTYEAMIPIEGEPMVKYVLTALQSSPSVSSIVVVGPESLKSIHCPKIKTYIKSTGAVMENIKLALAEVGKENFLLMTTSDIPLLTPEAVEDFIQQSKNQEGDFFYTIVAKEANEEFCPGIKRTYVKLKDGIFTGGNLFFFHPGIVDRCWTFFEKMVKLRKKPLQMCAILGWIFIIRLVLGRLSIENLEDRVSYLLGIKAKAIISPYAEVGIDVDKLDDYSAVTRLISGRKR